MALEIVRKLVDNVWRTVLEDQGSGPGSTPNLAAVLAEGADAGGAGITGLDDPTADQDAATKKYVDDNGGSIPVNDLTFAAPSVMAHANFALVSTSTAPISSYSYNNPDTDPNNAVGSTVTCDSNEVLGASGADNLSMAQVGDRIVMFDSANGFFGVFTVTDLGGAGSPWVLTRATDADTQETFVRAFTIGITGGDFFDGGWLTTFNPETGSGLTVDDFSDASRAMLQRSGGSFALGPAALSSAATSVAIGDHAETVGGVNYATAVGASASAQAASATALGTGATATRTGQTDIAAGDLTLRNLPTSAVGLTSGQVYVDGVTLKLAP